MIETIENALQLTVSGVCSAICFIFAYRTKEREWDIMALYYATFFLGDLYWLLYLLLNHDTPNLSYVSEFAWYASYMFQLLIIRFINDEKATKNIHPLQWLVLPFVIGMCIFYMQWGDYFGNIVTMILMGLLLWNSIKGTLAGKSFCGAVLIICLIQYTMWSVSCFWSGDGITNPYFWFDFMFTVGVAFLLPIFAKAVKA